MVGVLNGTTNATFLDTKPSAGGLNGVDPNTISYVATLEITAKCGTVTTQDVGIYDLVHGKFASVSMLPAGTGRFKDATGFLFFVGQVLPGSRFTFDTSGEIDLP